MCQVLYSLCLDGVGILLVTYWHFGYKIHMYKLCCSRRCYCLCVVVLLYHWPHMWRHRTIHILWSRWALTEQIGQIQMTKAMHAETTCQFLCDFDDRRLLATAAFTFHTQSRMIWNGECAQTMCRALSSILLLRASGRPILPTESLRCESLRRLSGAATLIVRAGCKR